MKLAHCTSLLLLGLLICLLSPPVTCDSLPTHYYSYVKDNRDSDGTHHIFAKYEREAGFYSYSQSKIVKNIEVVVSFQEKNTFRVKILDADAKRWEIPEEHPFPHFKSNAWIPHTDSCCEVHIEKDPFFGFYITRKDTNEVIFDTRNRQLVYSDLYIEFSTALPSDNVFGFGERNSKFKLTPGTYTIWGRDDAKILENGHGGGNTYSHHPVGLIRDKTGNFFMTLMRNSNAMDVIIENKNSVPGLTYKIVGGVIDLVFFVGNDYPDNLLKAYHSYLGNFTMLPFWSLGYHQSKWGYTSYDKMNDVVTKYIDYGIPLDVIWSDIDYMIDKEIFTVDTDNYPPEKMRQLTTVHKKKWVPIIDPGVKYSNHKGPGTKEGLKRDVFLKNHKGEPLIGSVWPGKVYFPDFFNPNTEQYWGEMLEVLYKIIPFAGIWLDMNEVANFVDGEDKRPEWEKSVYDNIPYTPGSHPLKRKTISLDAVHYNNAVEYDTHSLFSLMENAATHKFLETKSKLPFILTRSTSMGVGRYAAHWTGDNGAYWKYLQLSIPGNFNFQIFGIPFVGADICGFMDGTNEELCARWTQVGALYPFARNHHEEKTRNQEPWTFNRNNLGVSVLETTKTAIKTRYSILKWYYSLFVETRGGGSIFRPLVFEFPHDEALYQDGFGDWQFLLGKSVLCTPKVESGDPYLNAYFPQATWYDLFTGQKMMDSGDTERTRRVEAPFNASAPLFLRGGHVVHRQNVDNVLTTEDLNNEFELIVGLEKSGSEGLLSAMGSMMGIETYDDDSVFHRCMEDNCLYDITVTVKDQDVTSATLEVKFERQDKNVKVPLDGFELNSLRVYGLPLDYMVDDEQKTGYGLVQMTSADEGNVSSPDLVDLVPVEENAFKIAFNGPIRVQEGDVLRIELMI